MTDQSAKSRLSRAFSIIPKPKSVIASMMRATSRIPFIDDVLAMYYCAVDPNTPRKIRIVIGGTLLYLVMPLDIIPDFLALVGYTDDISALMILLKFVSSHVTDAHREHAKKSLASMRHEPTTAEKEITA